MARSRQWLGLNESRLLVFLDDLGGELGSSGTIARKLFNRGDFNETPMQRGAVLKWLAILEERGYVERGPNGGWMGGRLTSFGRTHAQVERTMPSLKRVRTGQVRSFSPKRAIEAGTTAFPKRVTSVVGYDQRLLKPGGNNAKLGGWVTKGHYRGYAIYSLTLEERATCPKSCERWADCFGNSMSYAIRLRHGASLERRLMEEVTQLMREHPRGVLVRLHVLGDFYSSHYVNIWRCLCEAYPKLAVFGYTARAPDSQIGVTIRAAQQALGWKRFAIRHSTSDYETTEAWSTATWYSKDQAHPSGTFACPEQTGRVMSCGQCAACWEGRKPVAFHLH